MKIAFLVQGLFEKSDSIGFDCIYEYKRLKSNLSNIDDDIQIFAERFNAERYPGIQIGSLKKFYTWCKKNEDGLVVYHYCGAWHIIDQFLIERKQKTIIRWHNNTSPWFYFSENNYFSHTVEGFNNIVSLIKHDNFIFWVNSNFTQKQLQALGGNIVKSSIVYPASRYLEKKIIYTNKIFSTGTINLLFVGRVVAHKGHKSVIAVAERVYKLTGKNVIVHFAGREDAIKKDIETYAASIKNIEVKFYGEVSEDKLEKLYKQADVFVCMSEHEGFGLPVFEAMRCGLPTVVWANTALKELLINHPFYFPYYDLNLFASAIVSLQNKDIYHDVLEAQKSILMTYNVDIIDYQISDALKHVSKISSRDYEGTLPVVFKKETLIKNELKKNINYNVSQQIPMKNLFHDSNYNLFSRYDQKIFYKLFKQLERIRFSSFENYSNNGRYMINGRNFRHRFGTNEGESVNFPYGHYKKGHLVFGPYCKLPEGDYLVEFDISILNCSVNFFSVDVSTEKHGVLKNKRIFIKKLPFQSPKLHFAIDDDDDLVEFRIIFRKDFTGKLKFNGVLLKQK